MREDVLLKWANDAEGAKVLFKARPLSAPAPTSSRVSATHTLDAMGALLRHPRLNREGHILLDRSGDSLAVALSPDAWFPQDKGERTLDVPFLLERAQGQPKAASPKLDSHLQEASCCLGLVLVNPTACPPGR